MHCAPLLGGQCVLPCTEGSFWLGSGEGEGDEGFVCEA